MTIELTPDQELVLETIDKLSIKNRSIYIFREDLVSLLTTAEGSKTAKAPMTKTQLERGLSLLIKNGYIDLSIPSNLFSRTLLPTPKELQEIYGH